MKRLLLIGLTVLFIFKLYSYEIYRENIYPGVETPFDTKIFPITNIIESEYKSIKISKTTFTKIVMRNNEAYLEYEKNTFIHNYEFNKKGFLVNYVKQKNDYGILVPYENITYDYSNIKLVDANNNGEDIYIPQNNNFDQLVKLKIIEEFYFFDIGKTKDVEYLFSFEYDYKGNLRHINVDRSEFDYVIDLNYYYENNLLVMEKYGDQQTSYFYDENNILEKKVIDGSLLFDGEYFFNINGNIVNQSGRFLYLYEYDKLGNIIKVTIVQNKEWLYSVYLFDYQDKNNFLINEYDKDGNLKTIFKIELTEW